MPTETTATMLVGGRSTHFGSPVFNASHVLTLREGFRGTWTANSLGRMGHQHRVRLDPPTADDLWVGGLLLAMHVREEPDLKSHGLDELLICDRGRQTLSFEPVGQDLSKRVTEIAHESLDAALSVLPGCSLGARELEMAREFGWITGVAERTLTPADEVHNDHEPELVDSVSGADEPSRPATSDANVVSLEDRR